MTTLNPNIKETERDQPLQHRQTDYTKKQQGNMGKILTAPIYSEKWQNLQKTLESLKCFKKHVKNAPTPQIIKVYQFSSCFTTKY